MPVDRVWRGKFGPEWALAAVASLAFLGFLGSTELWGKREQRAAAEAVDTVAHGHWLVGEIQGRPRLEKPPLPRWITAALIVVSGRSDEFVVRLPGALAALVVVALVYVWGRSVGGRAVGLASGFALASTPFFVVEMRQAGVDGFLTLFTTLGLFAASKRWGLERFPIDRATPGNGVRPRLLRPGPKGWSLGFFAAAGLGFLTKGPVIFLWLGVPVVGFLLTRRRLREGLRLLVDGRGLILFALLALAWPLAVGLRYPSALGVWWLEIGQKTGVMGVEHGNARGSILLEALGMTLPWTPLALVALVGPIRRCRQADDAADSSHPSLSLAWWWAFAPLAVLGTWDVAKPNYYLPALPAAAILVGHAWMELAHRAREVKSATLARLGLQAVWSGLFASAIIAPVVVNEIAPSLLASTVAASLAVMAGSLAAVWFWRRGEDSSSLASAGSALVAVALIAYGAVAPAENPSRGHRTLALKLNQILPPGTTPWFFDDLDEGLWFYAPALDLKPIPPTAPETPKSNRGHTLRASVKTGQTRAEVAEARTHQAVDQLTQWADRAGPGAFLLIRGKLFDRLALDLPPRFAPIFRESGVERNELVLLQIRTPAEVAALPGADRR